MGKIIVTVQIAKCLSLEYGKKISIMELPPEEVQILQHNGNMIQQNMISIPS